MEQRGTSKAAAAKEESTTPREVPVEARRMGELGVAQAVEARHPVVDPGKAATVPSEPAASPVKRPAATVSFV